MKLSKTQKELLIALQNGDRLFYMPYMGNYRPIPYFFLSSSFKRVTAAAKALIEKRLIKDCKKSSFAKNDYQLTELGKNWKENA